MLARRTGRTAFVLLGTAILCAALVVLATRAHANASTCSFGSNTITLTIAPGESITLRTVDAGGGVTNFESNATGDNSFQQCGTADNSNTTAINVTGDTGNETLTLDESSGLYFQDGSNVDIPISVDLGSGTDTLVLNGTPQANTISLGSGGINLESDGDVNVTDTNVEAIVVNGSASAGDTISGAGNVTVGAAITTPLTENGLGGNDILTGGAGNDTLNGGAAGDALNGGGGTDTADYSTSPSGVTVTVNGSASGGDAAGDTLANLENLTGSAFNDSLTGDGNANTLSGGDGNDTLAGLGGADSLDGGNGTDTADYSASPSAVTITVNGAASGGDAAGDTLANLENLTGSAFNDSLTGDGNANSLVGGSGNDTLAGLGGADSLDGGPGTDTTDYSASPSGVNMTVNGSGSGGDAAGDALANVENITGSGFDDTLTGDVNANVLAGGAGNDDIAGLAGADTLSGGTGIDTLDYSADTAGVTVNLTSNSVSGGDAAGDIISGFENATGGSGNDTLTGDGNGNALSGNGGTDTLAGLGGADTLDGGPGTDTADYTASPSGVNVTVNATSGNTGGDAAGDSLSNMENLTGSASNDTLTGDGNANVLLGANGNDTLAGLGGADTLNGGIGTNTADYSASPSGVTVTVNGAGSGGDAAGDTLLAIQNLTGSAFADTLTGDINANVLSGGDGNDSLLGLAAPTR